jgi:hypothetical protein
LGKKLLWSSRRRIPVLSHPESRVALPSPQLCTIRVVVATNSSERSGVFSAYAAFFFAALNFAQRARAAAAIRFLPAAEIVRLRFTGTGAVIAACFDPFRAFAHRFF